MPQLVSRSSICEMLARFSEGLDTAEAEHCRSQLIINHPGSGRPAPASAPGMPRIQEEAEEYIEASVCGGSSAASSSRNTASTRGSSRMSGYNSFYQGSHKMLQTNDNIAFSKEIKFKLSSIQITAPPHPPVQLEAAAAGTELPHPPETPVTG